MITPPEELPELVFYDPDGPVARELLTLPEDEAERAQAQIQHTWSLACTGKFVWPIPQKGLAKRLHRISAATLIIWGSEDKLVPPIYAEEFAARIPNARVELVAEAAHVPHLEQLGTVSALVRDFLAL
jgi:pimeloyl-ACP methyl ester carboxylesterase